MERLLTPEEVADTLRVTRRTVYEWLRTGRLRGLKAGPFWRIRPEDLDRFLAGADNGTNGAPLQAGRVRPLESDDEDDEPTAEELADAEAGWREYLEGKARSWDESRKELTHDA
ncbi:MAG TPA: helix-turn-helix domain-containing protein [Limnochordales bacterium]